MPKPIAVDELPTLAQEQFVTIPAVKPHGRGVVISYYAQVPKKLWSNGNHAIYVVEAFLTHVQVDLGGEMAAVKLQDIVQQIRYRGEEKRFGGKYSSWAVRRWSYRLVNAGYFELLEFESQQYLVPTPKINELVAPSAAAI